MRERFSGKKTGSSYIKPYRHREHRDGNGDFILGVGRLKVNG